METTTAQAEIADLARLVEAGADLDAIARLVKDGADLDEIASLVEDGAEIDEIAAYYAMADALPENVDYLRDAIFGRYQSEEEFTREYVLEMFDMSEPAISYLDYSKYWECELRHHFIFDHHTGYVLVWC